MPPESEKTLHDAHQNHEVFMMSLGSSRDRRQTGRPSRARAAEQDRSNRATNMAGLRTTPVIRQIYRTKRIIFDHNLAIPKERIFEDGKYLRPALYSPIRNCAV
jgi:hypothetical protein